MRNFIHNKKDSDTSAPEVVETAVAAEETDAVADDQMNSEVLSAEDVETEKLKNAIAQVMAEESAVLPHIEQLSSSVARESGITDDEPAESEPDEPREKRPKRAVVVPDSQAKVSSWFVTFMAMRIPVIGWIYLLYLAFSRKTVNRRNFARAYLIVKMIFLILGVVILFILFSMATNILQDLLDYMAML